MPLFCRLTIRKRGLYFCTAAVSTLVVVFYISISHKSETGEPSTNHVVANEPNSNSIEKELRDTQTSTTPESELSFEASSESQSGSVASPLDFSEQDKQRVGPFNSLEPSKDQVRILYNATEALIKQCMNQRGFKYEIRDYGDLMQLDVSVDPAVQGDLDEATVRGYGLAEYFTLEDTDIAPLAGDNESETMLFPSELFDPNLAHTHHLSSTDQYAWNAALYGEVAGSSEFSESSSIHVENQSLDSVSWDDNSCIAVAEEKIHGNSKKASENLTAKEALQTEVVSMTDNDVEFQIALDQWKNCMVGYGLEFDRPGEAEQMLYQDYVDGKIDLDTLRQKEMYVAKFDAVCYSQHGVAEAFDQAVQRSEALLMETHSNQIEGLRQSLEAAIERAESYIQ